tara:strand:+ start:4761 stop:5159 length:399 start_codon:yes stop_codon:yes gene_type:complete
MLNRCEFIGNLGREIETRFTKSGEKVVTFSIAVTEKWKDGENTEWVKVVVFNQHLAKIAEDYLAKGSKVYIAGKMKTRKWTNKDGADVYTTEVVMGKFDGTIELLSPKSETSGGGGYEPQPGGDDLEDSIPF